MAASCRRSARVVLHRANTPVATVEVADSIWTRMVGLLTRGRLEHQTGMLLAPCCAIHTWFMRFPIDVLFVDAQGEVLRAVDNLQPFRSAAGGPRARAVVELAAGARRTLGIAVGDVLRIGSA